MDFDPTQGHILIWQPPLPPETTVLIPTNPTAEQVDLRAPAPPGDPPCWLTEHYFEGEHAALTVDHTQQSDDTAHHAPKAEDKQPDGQSHTVEMLANLIATNAMLEFTLNLGRQEKDEDEEKKLKEKKEEDEPL
ncbi:MAG TPA: hypothetical protein VKS79_19595 [Gemmataceae bacterium]|nr:hypothetical protein [Gemmataceae bacterium]